MQGVIENISGTYLRCVLENGDVVKIHNKHIGKEVNLGDVLKVTFAVDEEATKAQRELMQKKY
ncbi:MAG: DUF3006 domain-containing protein [Candidatus Riflebacteria bacterium]|nr:DUF3006 domain-containing protein [Candidatus Riflebacteria bacterium]